MAHPLPPYRLAALDPNPLALAKEKLNRKIMMGDHMFSGSPQYYFDVGESALRIIYAVLLLANANEPANILDFACGSGRVARWLRAGFPTAQLDVSDLRDDSLAFCETSFNASAWKSSPDISSLSAPREYDLIWSGSLLTHLPEEQSKKILQKFYSWLSPQGICIVTVHGRRAIDNLTAKRLRYVPEESVHGIVEEFSKGYSFRNYKNSSLGASFSSLDWALNEARTLDAKVIALSESPWGRHHDIIALQKSPP